MGHTGWGSTNNARGIEHLYNDYRFILTIFTTPLIRGMCNHNSRIMWGNRYPYGSQFKAWCNQPPYALILLLYATYRYVWLLSYAATAYGYYRKGMDRHKGRTPPSTE
ncbi:hypothetical protein G9A89_000300, partial [Geosiphon pyriformis]